METFCIFCGQRPENKNKEHVLPKWLIKLTGDPNRIASFGVDFAKEPFAVRQFSFDALTFPACSECNNNFARLETAAEPIVRALLSLQPVTAENFVVLLDWMDKVRVGLWLGYLYLNGNPLGITPSFHIQNRVGQLDRMMAIVKLAESSLGLSFLGPESGLYQLSPTCLALRINSLCFVNASGVSLCSQRLGFPFAKPLRLRDDHKLVVTLHPGLGRIMHPIERSPCLPKATHLYQPVFRTLLESDGATEYLDTRWVSNYTISSRRGYGKVFLQTDGSICTYPEAPSPDWIPSGTWMTKQVLPPLVEYVYGRLAGDIDEAIAITENPDRRKHMRRQTVPLRMIDRTIIKRLKG